MMSDIKHRNVNGKSRNQPGRVAQLIEVSVFLALYLIVPFVTFSFFPALRGRSVFARVADATILSDLALVGLILFFLRRNDESVERIGWTFKNGWKDVALGVGLFVPFYYGSGWLESVLLGLGLSAPSTLPSFLTAHGIGEYLLASLLIGVVAVAEETIFRGYLLLRFRAITTSPVMAVLLSALIFSLGHVYEGSAGVITVGVAGLLYALLYLWRRSLVAPVVIHFLQDFVDIVLLPALGIG